MYITAITKFKKDVYWSVKKIFLKKENLSDNHSKHVKTALGDTNLVTEIKY